MNDNNILEFTITEKHEIFRIGFYFDFRAQTDLAYISLGQSFWHWIICLGLGFTWDVLFLWLVEEVYIKKSAVSSQMKYCRLILFWCRFIVHQGYSAIG